MQPLWRSDRNVWNLGDIVPKVMALQQLLQLLIAIPYGHRRQLDEPHTVQGRAQLTAFSGFLVRKREGAYSQIAPTADAHRWTSFNRSLPFLHPGELGSLSR